MSVSTGSRIVILTCGSLGIKAAREIARLDGVGSILILRTPYRTPERSFVGKLRHTLKYGGVGAVLRIPIHRLGRVVPRPAPDDDDDLGDHPSIRLLEFDDFSDGSCLAALREFDADLGVIAGTYILPESVFALPRLGSINLHTGKAPEYRGSAPGFWEMYNGETRVGITIHWVTADVDSGRIIRQEMFPFNPAPEGDPFTYIQEFRNNVLLPNGLRLLVAAVSDIVRGTQSEIEQDPPRANTYRLPTHRHKLELRRRVAERRNSGWKRQGKRLIGWLLFRSGLYRRFTAGTAFVVLFHRVDDRYEGNPISCTTREFDAYCRFFARYFESISASHLLDRLERGEDISRRITVTFDDGYADNVAAAETMKRYGLDGCFFVATEYIGSDRNGWWDVEQGCVSHWMTWDAVRQLTDWGFEIGSHTMNHVNLGKLSGEEAVVEIQGSRAILEEKLDTTIDLIGYPFGGGNNITDDNIGIIKASGYRSCMSAYGGVVTPDVDPFDLPRVAVSPWHRSPWQLGLELILEARRARRRS